MVLRRAALPAALLAAGATLLAVGFHASIAPKSREGNNLALGKQVLGTFSEAQRITDGEKGGGRYSESGDPGKEDQYLIVSLGQPHNIHAVSIDFAEGGIPSWYVATLSRDLVRWEDAPGKVEVRGPRSVFRPEGKTALFLRLAFPKGCSKRPIRIEEIEVTPVRLTEIEISEVRKVHLGEHEVEFEWETDIDSQSTVRLGLSPGSLKDREIDASYSREHRCRLKGLLKGTDYFMRVVAIGPGGFREETRMIRFRTAGIPLPLYRGIRVERSTPETVELRWEANVPVRCRVRVSGKGIRSIRARGRRLSKSHRLRLDGFRGSTPFTLEIEAEDEFGNEVGSGKLRFSSAEDNRALGKTPEGTFVRDLNRKIGSSDGEMLARVTDGDLDALSGTAVSYSVAAAEQYATIDLGKEIPVERIEVYWRAVAYAVGYRVDGSRDGREWWSFGEGLSAEGIPHFLSRGRTGDPVISQVVPGNGREARYVRFFAPAGTKVGTIDPKFDPPPVLMLAEVKVFPVPEKGRLRIKADMRSD